MIYHRKKKTCISKENHTMRVSIFNTNGKIYIHPKIILDKAKEYIVLQKSIKKCLTRLKYVHKFHSFDSASNTSKNIVKNAHSYIIINTCDSLFLKPNV